MTTNQPIMENKSGQSPASNMPWGQQHPWQMGGATLGAATLAGMLSSLMSGGMMGKKERVQQVPLYSPEIMNLKNRMAPELYSQIMGNQYDFGPVEQLTRQNFQSQTIPSIMNRFNFAGNRGSGGLNAALSSAGSNLDMQLAAMRQNYNQQRQGLLASLMGTSLTPSFENVGRPRQPGALEGGGDAIMTMLPYLIKALAKAA